MRERRRERRRLDEVARGYEASGDIAMARFAYVEATPWFERALAESQTAEDEIRLCNKIGDSLLYGARPDLATPWFERVVERCQTTASLHGNTAIAMSYIPLQYWLESRTAEALDYSLQTRKLAATAEDAASVQALNVQIAGWLTLLGHYAEAENYVLPSTQNDGVAVQHWIRVSRFNRRAIIWAAQGRASEAFAEFDRAIQVAKEAPDGFLTTVVWDDYANWATALGRLDIARACRERALLVARERRIAWRIPYLSLRFANMLVIVGDYDHARDLVRDALTYDTTTPAIHVLLSIAGVEIAITLGDEELLKRTFDSEALALAMKSGEPERIAPIVAAYVKVLIARGERRRAKTLITRAMNAIAYADQTGDLLVIATRYGSQEEASRAQRLLHERIQLPHHRVAEAYLALCEAYALQRRSVKEMRQYAQRAAQLFGRLGRRHQQAEALTLLGASPNVLEKNSKRSVLSHLDPTLTTRERQVADLVLRGLTNRAIAETLAISEHTVETHMTSILNRLGLRSRWQLIGSLRA